MWNCILTFLKVIFTSLCCTIPLQVPFVQVKAFGRQLLKDIHLSHILNRKSMNIRCNMSVGFSWQCVCLLNVLSSIGLHWVGHRYHQRPFMCGSLIPIKNQWVIFELAQIWNNPGGWIQKTKLSKWNASYRFEIMNYASWTSHISLSIIMHFTPVSQVVFPMIGLDT